MLWFIWAHLHWWVFCDIPQSVLQDSNCHNTFSTKDVSSSLLLLFFFWGPLLELCWWNLEVRLKHGSRYCTLHWEFFCTIWEYLYLRKEGNHKPWQKESLLRSRCRPSEVSRDVFPRSFRERHNKEIHRRFSAFPQVYRCWKDQSQQFWWFCHSQSGSFQV